MKVVAIPEKMQKFYGTGTMLHPDEAMIYDMISEIPFGKVATIDSCCEKLASDFETNVACPMRTSHLVKVITESNIESERVPFWRVIRKNHLLINSKHAGRCAENLKAEGFEVTQTRKGEYKVQGVENKLYVFN